MKLEVENIFFSPFQLIVILYFGKSAINPIIYGWKNNELRSEFLRTFSKNSSTVSMSTRSSAILTLIESVAAASTTKLMHSLRHGSKKSSNASLSRDGDDVIKDNKEPKVEIFSVNGLGHEQWPSNDVILVTRV